MSWNDPLIDQSFLVLLEAAATPRPPLTSEHKCFAKTHLKHTVSSLKPIWWLFVRSHTTCLALSQSLGSRGPHTQTRLLQAASLLADRSWEDQSSDFECTAKENNRREGVREAQIERQSIDKAHQDLY